MSNPPDALDFLQLFEAEPELLDPNVPWIYNTATYRLERGGRTVVTTISPSYSYFQTSVSLDGQLIAEAEVAAFTDIDIVSERSREVLIVKFGELSASALYLTLSPTITLAVAAGSDA